MSHVTGVIGVSSSEYTRYAMFYDELTSVERPPDTLVSHSVGLYINENRNQLSDHAIELGAEWIWFVDDDHCFQPDTLTRLLAHDVDIVSGVYVRRTAPFLPVVYEQEDNTGDVVKHYFTPQDRGLKPILACGGGCLLVKTKVLKALGTPYWRFSQRPDGEMIGEDIDFCYRARAAGFTVWCDFDTTIGHLATVVLYPHQVTPGKWNLKVLDTKGRLVVAGPTAVNPNNNSKE